MKVILLKNVPGLGKAGEVKECKEGFAKNHLIPQGLAKTATEGALASLSLKQHQEEEKKQKELTQNKKLIDLVKTIDLVFTLKMSKGSAFGSITKKDILQKLKERGIELPKEALLVEKPIKKTGVTEIPVSLGSGINGSLRITLAPKE